MVRDLIPYFEGLRARARLAARSILSAEMQTSKFYSAYRVCTNSESIPVYFCPNIIKAGRLFAYLHPNAALYASLVMIFSRIAHKSKFTHREPMQKYQE